MHIIQSMTHSVDNTDLISASTDNEYSLANDSNTDGMGVLPAIRITKPLIILNWGMIFSDFLGIGFTGM